MNKNYSSRNNDIDVERAIRYLNFKFNELTSDLPDNSKGTDLYYHQIEYNYLIDAIRKSPKYSVGKMITKANTFLAELEASKPH